MSIRNIIFLVTFFICSVSKAQVEKVVVYVQDTTKYFADSDFIKNHYPKLQDYATKNKLSLEVRDVKHGVPEGLISTPSIHYYDAKKHLVFKGRYTEIKRIQNWVKISKLISSKNDAVSVKNAFSGNVNGALYAFPIKVITSHDKYWKSIKYPIKRDSREIDSIFKLPFKSDEHFLDFKESNLVSYHNRKYYLDFYPYRTKKKLFISVKIFSEFHCKIPVFETEIPLSSSYKKKDQLILKAKQLALSEVKKLMLSGETGDAHTNFIGNNEPILTDESMGVGISKSNKTTQPFPSIFPDKWTFDSKENSSGNLRFLVPNSIYTGEIIDFKSELNLSSMNGSASAHLTSLSTGDVGLDYSITDRILAEEFGVSKITFKEVLSKPNSKINDWSTYQYSILCDFTFAGKTVEEEIELTLAPVINSETNEVELYCYSTFSILMMRQFGIESGVGESEEEDTVEFYLDFKMKSK